MLNDQSAKVKRRHVFYLGGFDPRGATFYHRLYKQEALKQGEVNGAEFNVSPRTLLHRYCQSWTATAKWLSGQRVDSVNVHYFFLKWDDIVRQHWEKNVFKLAIQFILAYPSYLSSASFKEMRRHYRGPFFSFIYSSLYLLFLACLSMTAALMAGLSIYSNHSLSISAVIAITLFYLLLKGGIQLGNALGVFWLLRTYLFVYQSGFNNSAFLIERVKAFIDLIEEKNLDQDMDELLIVGHSVGSILAIHLAAIYLERHPDLVSRVALATLGHCIPAQSEMPEAHLLKTHLALLKNHQNLRWIDFVARIDSLAFAPSPEKFNDTSLSHEVKIVRFFRLLSNSTYQRIKNNKLRMHFQYLMATELSGDFDYFELTSGPIPLNGKIKDAHDAL